MEKVHLDFLGPLPHTEAGNEYILMMVDSFTKWVECVPLPSQTAEVTARAAIMEFFVRFGYPFEIFTEQGRNFESELFRKICSLLQIHKSRTTPYRPSGNGQVERYNRTLMDAVRCYVDNQVKSWDKHLGILAGALRSAVNRHTGYTPNRLMLGREVNSPATLQSRPPPGEIRSKWGGGRGGHLCGKFRKNAQGVPRVGQSKIARSSKVDEERLRSSHSRTAV